MEVALGKTVFQSLKPLLVVNTPLLGREEAAILSVPQGLVEVQESRRFQNDGGTDQAGWPHQQSAPTGDEAVRKAERGSALARAIED